MRYMTIFLLLVSSSWASKYAGEPFNFGNDARYLGMGNTGTAIVEGPASLFWNVAGLAKSVDSYHFVFLHGSYFNNLHSTENIAFSKKGVLSKDLYTGVRLYLLQSSGIKSTELQNPDEPIGPSNPPLVKKELSYRTGMLQLGFAKNSGTVSWGVAFKVVYEDLSIEKGYGFGIDMGLQGGTNHISYGIVIKDAFTTPLFWSSGLREYIWPQLRMGTAVRFSTIVIAVDLTTLFENYGSASPYSISIISFDPNIGIEWTPLQFFALRTGIDRGNMTFGLGLKFSKFAIDYALLRHPDLDGSHRISLGVIF